LLACQKESTLTFGLTLQNRAAAPTASVIGTILANDKKYLPDQVDFTISRPGAADINFRYFDPAIPAVAGRLRRGLAERPR
jgi:hypothetical protein